MTWGAQGAKSNIANFLPDLELLTTGRSQFFDQIGDFDPGALISVSGIVFITLYGSPLVNFA